MSPANYGELRALLAVRLERNDVSEAGTVPAPSECEPKSTILQPPGLGWPPALLQ